MKQFYFILLGCLLCIASNSFSQSSYSGQEKIYVHTDREIYVSGENIWFSVYCLDAQSDIPSPTSAIAYIELLDQEGEPVIQQKVGLKHGLGKGQLSLEPEISTGHYTLRAYTLWMRNFDAELWYEAAIYVLNPARPPVWSSAETSDAQPYKSSQINSNSAIELKLSKKEFGQREKVELRIQRRLKKGLKYHLSLAVAKIDPDLSLPVASMSNILQKKPAENQSVKIDFPPEMQTASVQGNFIGNVEAPEKIFLSFPGKTVELYAMSLDEDQRFATELSPSIPDGDMLFWTLDQQLDSDQLLIKSPFSQAPLEQKDRSFLGEEWRPLLESYLFNRQISIGYNSATEVNGLPMEGQEENRPFYDQAKFSYRLDDYTRFPSLDEVFLEYVGKAHKRKIEGKKHLFLWDEYVNTFTLTNSAVFDEPALMMIDGVPILNPDTFWDFDVLKVEYLDLITKQYHANDHLFHGLVHLRTYGQNFGDKSLPDYIVKKPFVGIQDPWTFQPKVYEEEDIADDRIPDFRTTLHWEAHLKIHEQSSTVTFFTGDDSGTYRIVIQGISENGDPIFAELLFNVAESK